MLLIAYTTATLRSIGHLDRSRRRTESTIKAYEPTYKCGWLTKQGGGKGGWKNWKKRWFVIKKNSLDYFEKPQVYSSI